MERTPLQKRIGIFGTEVTPPRLAQREEEVSPSGSNNSSMMKQPLLFFLFLAGLSLSAFQRVIEWDGDTSLETSQKRAALADELWTFYQKNQKMRSGEMALFYSFAISLRNDDQAPIIGRFEQVKPDGQLWALLYPFYKKALAQTYTYEKGAAVLKSNLRQAKTAEQRIQLNYDIGYWAFYEGRQEEAKPYTGGGQRTLSTAKVKNCLLFAKYLPTGHRQCRTRFYRYRHQRQRDKPAGLQG